MESKGMKKLSRGKTFIAGGVCAGLAKCYGLNKGGIQACFLFGSLFYGVTILIYLALWALLPKEAELS
jgi:phage shock protein PspC (stress-responsive transcriptional regulator)